MELYIFNRNLEFKGILDTFFSFRWIRRYFKYGEFELKCALTPVTLELLKRENIIYKKDDPEAGYIEFRNLKQDAEGKEILIVRGKFLTGYLNRRIIWGTEVINTTAEVAMRTLVNKNCITPIDSNRIIPNLILGTLNNFTDAVNYQVSYQKLSDELENLSKLSNLGYRINFDIAPKILIFNVYKGLDRSCNQSVNPRAIFSQEFENILGQEFTDSLNNFRNVALVGGTISVGNAAGLDRFELYVDGDTADKGNIELSNTKDIQTFDSKVNLNSNLLYKADFDLGDVVTCISKKWGITLDTRITEIEEVYEETGKQINVTFGNNIPTLIDKIKQKLR